MSVAISVMSPMCNTVHNLYVFREAIDRGFLNLIEPLSKTSKFVLMVPFFNRYDFHLVFGTKLPIFIFTNKQKIQTNKQLRNNARKALCEFKLDSSLFRILSRAQFLKGICQLSFPFIKRSRPLSKGSLSSLGSQCCI